MLKAEGLRRADRLKLIRLVTTTYTTYTLLLLSGSTSLGKVIQFLEGENLYLPLTEWILQFIMMANLAAMVLSERYSR